MANFGPNPFTSYLSKDFLDGIGFQPSPGGHYLPRYVTHESVPQAQVEPVLLRPREPSIIQPAWVIAQSDVELVLRYCHFL